MTELEIKIKEAAQAYYTDGSSNLTDEEFDALVDRLRKERPDSQLLRIGWGYETYLDSTPGDKVKHKYGRAGSLDKCRTWKELGTTLQTSKVDVSLKLDGISIVLYYVCGELVKALTRGDGEIGIDVTDKVNHIISNKIDDVDFTGAVRGEILMSYKNFEQFKEIHPEAKNPRNSTAGIINGKDTFDDLKYLDLIVYTVVGVEHCWQTFSNIAAVRGWLDNNFAKVVPHTDVITLSEDMFIHDCETLRDAWYGTYPADGLVITVEDVLESGEEVSYDAKAFKFAAEQKECEVAEVEWDMTKTRYAMPRIHIKPTELSGTTVEYCTGYNAQYIKENNIGPGSIIKVQKRGEIIPNVDEVVKSTQAQIITHCLDCGQLLTWKGVHLQCTNESCSNAIQQDTLIWMGQIAPKEGLGDKLKIKMLSILLESGELPDISIESIMESKIHLSNTTSQVKQNDFADMWETLHTCEVPMANALLALNVPRIGGITAIKFSEHEDIIWCIVQEALNESMDLPLSLKVSLERAIGQANAQSVEDNLWKFARLNYLKKRIKSAKKLDTPSKGKVAITGKLSIKRSEFEDQLRAVGYTPNDISKDTKFLITDDPNSSSSKNKKADQWGITKITEQDFRDRYM